jgi:prevent-host-death family protein
MELSIREAKARFSEAIAAVQAGERVVVTKYGKEVAEILSIKPRKGGLDFELLDAYKAKRGWVDGSLRLPDDFDDPVSNRKLLGLDD